MYINFYLFFIYSSERSSSVISLFSNILAWFSKAVPQADKGLKLYFSPNFLVAIPNSSISFTVYVPLTLPPKVEPDSILVLGSN